MIVLIVFLTSLLQYLAKNMALLVHGFFGDFFCQIRFRLIQVPMTTNLEALVVGPRKKITFFAASLRDQCE